MLHHSNPAERRSAASSTSSKGVASATTAPKPVVRSGAAPRRPQATPAKPPTKPLTAAQRLDICASGLRAGLEGRQRLYGAHTREAINLWYAAYDLAARERRAQLAAQANPLAATLGWRVRPLEIDPLSE